MRVYIHARERVLKNRKRAARYLAGPALVFFKFSKKDYCIILNRNYPIQREYNALHYS